MLDLIIRGGQDSRPWRRRNTLIFERARVRDLVCQKEMIVVFPWKAIRATIVLTFA